MIWFGYKAIVKIIPFAIFFFLILLSNGIPLSMLDLNRTEENRLIEITFDYWLLDVWYFEFMHATGGTNMENPEHGDWANMVLVLLFGATLIM